MNDPIQRALDSITRAVDGGRSEPQYVAKTGERAPESGASDDEMLGTVEALRAIEAIARVHNAHPGSAQRSLPFSWGPLEVREYIARGAHGDVYRAWDPRLEREVALKLLVPDGTDEHEAPFAIAEGRLLARVRHANVIAVYGADRINGQAGIWMELVEGGTLRAIVTHEGPLPPSTAVQIGIDLAGGLAAVHAAGLIHRDVKAQDVLRDSKGRTILMDLGAGQDGSSEDDRLEGTPVYLAPELLEDGCATVASDIYALGVLLFFLVTGRYPVTAGSLDELRQRHRAGDGDRLGRNRRLPAAFSAAVDRALSKDPADRFASADEMRVALQSARRGPLSRRLFPVAVAVAVVLAGTGLVLRYDEKASPSHSSVPAELPADVSVRKVRLPHYEMGVPSADGRFFPYADESGTLHIWEVGTGRSRRVAEGDRAAGLARSSLLSRKGDRLVYGWRLPDGAHELLSLNADATWPRVVLPRQTAYEPVPLDWSRDGATLLCLFRQKNGTSDLVLVSFEGGAVTLLHSFDATADIDASLSPDGRFVAAAAGVHARTRHGLMMLETARPAPWVLLANTAEEGRPLWMPDGRHIFFLRNSVETKGSRDGWILPVVNGIPEGEPVRVASNLGSLLAATVTEQGALYGITSIGSSDVYTSPIDLSAVSPPGPPTRIAAGEIGRSAGPSWSPDGRVLAYFRTREPGAPGLNPLRTLTVQETGSGSAREIALPLAFLGGYAPAWSPDGRYIVVWGAMRKGRIDRATIVWRSKRVR